MSRSKNFRYQIPTSRRSFLAATTVFAASGLLISPQTQASEELGPITIQPTAGQDLVRVRMEMDVKGNVNIPSDPLVSRESELTLPITSKAILDYEERYRRPEGADPTSLATAVERYYHEASSEGQLNRTKTNLKLRDSVRQTQVRRDSLPETIYSVDDYFTHDELSLLRVPVCSSAVDEMLPTKPISKGDRYSPSEATLTSVLNLSAVQATTVSVEVVDVDESVAKFQFRGRVDGSVEGVPTTINTVGKLTFDRKMGTCSWLAMAIHETREIGRAEPGFDVAATIKMVRQPLPKVVALPRKPAAMAITKAIPQDRMYVEVKSEGVGVASVMDRRWKVMTDLNGNTMLRMIENERSIAQCNIRTLARLEPGKQWTLEAFQEDVRRTLGNEMEDLLEADQRLSISGLRVLRVVANGVVEGVPIQWIMLHFSDDSGRRVLATFTMDSNSIDSFVGSDAQFADSLRFNAPEKPTTDKDSDKPDAEVAWKKSDGHASDEVQSSSDLR